MNLSLRAHWSPTRFLCVAAVYFLATRLGVLFVVQPEQLAVFWPGGGLLLGYLLVIDRKGWPAAAAAAFVGNVVGNMTAGHTLAVSSGFAAVNAVEPVLVVWLFGLLRRSPPKLTSTADVFRLFLVCGLGCAVTAVAGAAVVTVGLGSPSFLGVWKVWWLADGVGMVLFAPLVVAWAERLTADWWRGLVKAGPPVVLSAAVAWAIFVSDLARSLPLLNHAFPVFPFLLWVTLVGGWRAVSTATVLVACITVWGTTEGTGPLQAVGISATDRVLTAQAFAAVVCLSTLVLSFVLSERRQTEAALRMSEERFKAIFHSQFQFVGLMSTDGRLMEANRTALAAAGVREEDVLGKPFWETGWWTHDAPQQERLKQAVRTAAGGAQDRFEASHPTADGGLMWVDFSLTPFRDESGRVVLLIPEGRDVTTRKRMEAELAANEVLLRQFVTHAPAAIAMLDTELRYIRVSQRWLTDYHLTGQEVIGRTHYEVFPDVPERWKAVHRRVLAGAVESCDEDPFPRADGGMEWLQWETRPWHKPGGEIGGLIFFTQVITARKRTEDQLRASEERFRVLFETSSDAYLIYEDAAGIIDCNQATVAMLRRTSKTEVLGSQPRHFSPEFQPCGRRSAEKAREAIATARRDGVCRFDWTHKRADGDEFPTQVTLTPAELDGRGVLLVVWHDLTSRVRAEAALRESEERYRSVVDALAEGIVVQDASGRIVACNRRAEQVLGLTADQLADRTSLDPRWQAVRENGSPFPADEYPAAVALRTRQPVFDTVMGVDRPAGGRTWLTVNAIPFGTDGGSVVASFHDVTDARRLNEQILATLNEKEVMLREIHHRVKNNLAVIASLFHLQSGYVTDDATRRLLEDAQSRVRSMALVHEHLYNAADLGAVSFSDYANTLVGQLFRSYRLPTAPVALATDIRPVTLKVDQAIPCGLILNELVSNALKHAFPNERSGTLTVGLSERDGVCEVRVADDGAGISPEHLDGRPKSLGLRLVRALTRQLDGTVEFSPTHPGTRVCVTFAIGYPTGATHD